MSVIKCRVGPKGQITIPKEIRDQYQIQEGEDVTIIPGSDGFLVLHEVKSLRGILRDKFDFAEFETNLKNVRQEWTLDEQ